jgi:hypothetical protein
MRVIFMTDVYGTLPAKAHAGRLKNCRTITSRCSFLQCGDAND